MKKALITGITGQDGSYLAELLLDKGYEVHGIRRRSSTFGTQRIDHIFQDLHEEDLRLHLHHGDMVDGANLRRIVGEVEPDEVYNLAAQSHVAISFEQPEYTSEVNGLGTLKLLEAVREVDPDTRFYQASTSEMFGGKSDGKLSEDSRFHPRSPYAVSKVYAHWMAVNYREAYDLFACSGILFNHESPRRGKHFVTRKISRAVAFIEAGMQDVLYLGNLSARRDWGYAPEYVRAMWMILQQEQPEDYVIATGETHTVREFAEIAFSVAGIDLVWEGEGVEEIGINRETGNTLIKVDPLYFRPAEVDVLEGDASRARNELGWEHRTEFDELVRTMVGSDMKILQEEGKKGLDYLY